MIFVSYSHQDDVWRKRFETMAKPLAPLLGTRCWSDRDIQPSKKWREEINAAMNDAHAAVLLVSDNFLASDFIRNEELPFFMSAAEKKKVQVLWVLLTPCLWKKSQISELQACHEGDPKPLIEMSEVGWKKALLYVCEKLYSITVKVETPVINHGLKVHGMKQHMRNLQVLARPARRETEVLIYSSDKRWHTQGRVAPKSVTADCWFGDENTKPGATFKIVALVRGQHPRLSGHSTHTSLPIHLAASEILTVRRG